MEEPAYTIRAVAARTGLSQHLIRIWEKRYGAIDPARTKTNRRLYSAEQMERLSLLREVTSHGHTISAVATLPLATLRGMANASRGSAEAPQSSSKNGDPKADAFLMDALLAVGELNSAKLERTLAQATVALGSQGVLQRVIAPLAQKIGDHWRDGYLSAAHEHFASAVMRVFLGHLARAFAQGTGATTIIVATPSGQLHELGALLAAAAAANLGWNVVYLGASLPAFEIAGAARQHRARVVALSLVFPEDDDRLEQELLQLRRLLGDDVTILVGGRATSAYGSSLKKIDATILNDIPSLCEKLESLRNSGRIESAES